MTRDPPWTTVYRPAPYFCDLLGEVFSTEAQISTRVARNAAFRDLLMETRVARDAARATPDQVFISGGGPGGETIPVDFTPMTTGGDIIEALTTIHGGAVLRGFLTVGTTGLLPLVTLRAQGILHGSVIRFQERGPGGAMSENEEELDDGEEGRSRLTRPTGGGARARSLSPTSGAGTRRERDPKEGVMLHPNRGNGGAEVKTEGQEARIERKGRGASENLFRNCREDGEHGDEDEEGGQDAEAEREALAVYGNPDTIHQVLAIMGMKADDPRRSRGHGSCLYFSVMGAAGKTEHMYDLGSPEGANHAIPTPGDLEGEVLVRAATQSLLLQWGATEERVANAGMRSLYDEKGDEVRRGGHGDMDDIKALATLFRTGILVISKQAVESKASGSSTPGFIMVDRVATEVNWLPIQVLDYVRRESRPPVIFLYYNAAPGAEHFDLLTDGSGPSIPVPEFLCMSETLQPAGPTAQPRGVGETLGVATGPGIEDVGDTRPAMMDLSREMEPVIEPGSMRCTLTREVQMARDRGRNRSVG
jgi:hypothetical protein